MIVFPAGVRECWREWDPGGSHGEIPEGKGKPGMPKKDLSRIFSGGHQIPGIFPEFQSCFLGMRPQILGSEKIQALEFERIPRIWLWEFHWETPGAAIPWIPVEKLLLPKESLQIPFLQQFRDLELPNPEFPPWKSPGQGRIQGETPTLGMWEGVRRILLGSKAREFLGNTREEPSWDPRDAPRPGLAHPGRNFLGISGSLIHREAPWEAPVP